MDIGRATEADYENNLHSLLPKGPAWGKDELLDGAAIELARVHNRALDLIEESDPRSTSELLPDWERITGLPDPCVGDDQVLQARLDALVRHLRMQGGASIQYWIDLAAQFGIEITIDEFEPYTVMSGVGEPLTGEHYRFVWRVNMPNEIVVTKFTVMSGVGEGLSSWEEGIIECLFGRLKQAHTRLIFEYA